jgi:hypothetical protein
MLTAIIGIEYSEIEPENVNFSPVLYSDLSNSKKIVSAKLSEINVKESMVITNSIPILFPSTCVKSQFCI